MFLFLFAVCQLAHYFDHGLSPTVMKFGIPYFIVTLTQKQEHYWGGFSPLPPQAHLNSKLKYFKLKFINTFIANRVDELNVDIS